MVPTHESVRIEVVYAAPDRVIVKTYDLPAPARLADVLRTAAVDPAVLGVDVTDSPAGVFGRRMAPHHFVKDGDRVEIYRPLANDPKTARRARARESCHRTGSPRPR
jgi:putative ubiquitin-RnfH superfamily antitoxin RatB of RatAB toxin-antitoxin module